MASFVSDRARYVYLVVSVQYYKTSAESGCPIQAHMMYIKHVNHFRVSSV